MRYFAFAFALLLAVTSLVSCESPKSSFENVKPLIKADGDFEAFWGVDGDRAFVENFIKAAERSGKRTLTGLEITRIETRILPRFKRLTYEAWVADPATEKVIKRIEKFSKQHAKEMAEMLK